MKLPGDPPPLILLRLSDPASASAKVLVEVRVFDRDAGLAPDPRQGLHISVGEMLGFANASQGQSPESSSPANDGNRNNTRDAGLDKRADGHGVARLVIDDNRLAGGHHLSGPPLSFLHRDAG